MALEIARNDHLDTYPGELPIALDGQQLCQGPALVNTNYV